MLRSDRAIRVAILAVFLAAAAYLGYAMYDARVNPLQTVLAVEYTVEDTRELEGWILRRETPLYGYGTSVAVKADEGERLSAGQVFAVRYLGNAAMNRVAEIGHLELRVRQLRELLGGSGTGDPARDAAKELAAAVARGQLEGLEELTLAVETYIFRQSQTDASVLQQELDTLQGQILALEAASTGDTILLSAPEAGVFSSSTDGYEHLTPDALPELTPMALEALAEGGSISHKDTLGKLVTSPVWVFASIAQGADAALLRDADEVEVRFPTLFGGAVSMAVERVGAEQDGRAVLLLSSAEKLTGVLACRRAAAQVCLSGYTGIRVPVQAVHIDSTDGVRFVYVLESYRARRVDVTIVGEHQGYYYAQTGGSLREGMEIITVANDLADGKVVR